MSHLGQDIRYACRSLFRSPGFTLAAIATLAIGLGANTAIFSFVNAVLLKPSPYPNPERIVTLWEKPPGGGKSGISSQTYLDWQKENKVFGRVAQIGLTIERRGTCRVYHRQYDGTTRWAERVLQLSG